MLSSAESTPPPTLSIAAQAPGTRGNKPGRGRGGRKGRNIDRDNEDDYKEAKDAAKPSSVTLFDMVKNHLDIQEPETAAEKPIQPELSNRDYNEGQRSFGGRGGRGGGRGGRGGRGSRNQPIESRNNKPVSNQIYDKDDFSYSLGDSTKVSDLIKVQPKVEHKKTVPAVSVPNVLNPAQSNPTSSAAQSQPKPSYNKNEDNKSSRTDSLTSGQTDVTSKPQTVSKPQKNQPAPVFNNNYNQSRQNYQNNNYNQGQQQFNNQMNYPADNYYQNDYNNRGYQQPARQKSNWQPGDECLARHPNDNKVFTSFI